MTSRFINREALGGGQLPPIVPVAPTLPPAPVFLQQPSVSPGSGPAGTTFTATAGTISNGVLLSRAWLLNGTSISTGLAATPVAAGTLTYQETASGAGGTALSASLTMTVAAAPAPTFTRSPAITTDGSPQVGEVAAFDFGDGTGTVTSRLLRTDNSTVTLADASVGSYQWVNAGTYALEVTRTLNDESVTQSSSAVVVAAVSQGTIPAPTLSNADNFVSGTNPPRFKVTIPGPPFDKTLHELAIEWDNASSGAFSYAVGRSARITDLMAFANAEDATISNLTTQPSGQPFRSRTRLVRKSDNAVGSDSNYFIDTMAAAQIPPTSFDPAQAGAGTPNDAIRLSNDNRTAALGYPLSDQAAWSPLARGIGAKVSFTFAGTTSTYGFLFGTTRVVGQRKLAMVPGYTEVNGSQVATFDFNATDTVTFELVANATTPANIDILVSKNGGGATRLVLNSPAPLFFAGFLSGDPGRTVTIYDFSHWGTV